MRINPIYIPNVSSCSVYIVCLFIHTYQVEYAVLKAASEGRWEEINQVLNRPGQQERVLHAQNEVICTEQLTSSSSPTTQRVVLNKHTMQFRCSLIVVLFCSMQSGWSPLHFAVYYGHLNIVNQLVNVCRLHPEKKTMVRTGVQGLFACQVQVALHHKQLTVALSKIMVCKTDPYILSYLHNSSK